MDEAELRAWAADPHDWSLVNISDAVEDLLAELDRRREAMSNNHATIGRIAHYTLNAQDAAEINRRRVSRRPDATEGVQFHVGNTAREGDVYPMLICRVWVPEMVNGQVFLDGNDTLWVTSRHEGTEPGTWAWPQLVS